MLKRLLILAVMLSFVPLFSGCGLTEQARAATEPPAKTFDASKLFNELQAIREIDDAQNARLASIEDKIDALAARPVAAPAPLTPPSDCITVEGIDRDLQEYLAEWYRGPKTIFEGLKPLDIAAITDHLKEHQVTNTDGLNYPTLEAVHAARHEEEGSGHSAVGSEAESAISRGMLAAVGVNPLLESINHQPSTINPSCPNGQCPLQSRTITRERTVSQSGASAASVATQSHTWTHYRPVSAAAARRAARRCR